ncbi:unnamed protein product, partial [Polarella glacialis]
QADATCIDVPDDSGSYVYAITADSRRRRASSKVEYECSIRVDATTKQSQTRYEDLWRSVGSVHTATSTKRLSPSSAVPANSSAMGQATDNCNQQFVRSGQYACVTVKEQPDVRFEKSGYPVGYLIATWVLWPGVGLYFFFMLYYISRSALRNIHLPTIPLHFGFQVSPEEEETEEPVQAWTEPAKQPQPTKKSDFDREGLEGGLEQRRSFRKLTLDDLCPELFPGLRLRVKWGIGNLWYPATALSYGLTPVPAVRFRYDDMSVSIGSKRILPIEEAHGMSRIRLHEDALAQIAQRRILKGTINLSVFTGTTFSSLDLDGSGTLSVAELRTGLLKLNIALDDATLQALLRRLDTNHSGKIEAEEFRRFLSTMR